MHDKEGLTSEEFENMSAEQQADLLKLAEEVHAFKEYKAEQEKIREQRHGAHLTAINNATINLDLTKMLQSEVKKNSADIEQIQAKQLTTDKAVELLTKILKGDDDTGFEGVHEQQKRHDVEIQEMKDVAQVDPIAFTDLHDMVLVHEQRWKTARWLGGIFAGAMMILAAFSSAIIALFKN